MTFVVETKAPTCNNMPHLEELGEEVGGGEEEKEEEASFTVQHKKIIPYISLK